MGDDDDDFVDKGDVVTYLKVPFMHKVTKDHGDKGVELEIDIGVAGQCWQDVVEGLIVCRWTQNLHETLAPLERRDCILCG